MTSPIVKWAGGKTKLLPEIVKRLPERYRMYYEPFFGGGALFFHQAPPNAIISDINVDLFSLYLAVQVDVDKVIRSLSQMASNWGREKRARRRYYDKVRDEWNNASDRALWKPHKRAATFLFLNKTCFNGLWRVNASGQFNVPMGAYGVDHVVCDPEKLRCASSALRRTKIWCGSYEKACARAGDGDFVYFDPPYDPVSSSSSFTSYTSGGFGRDAQRDLANLALERVHAGAQVMLSNADTKFIRELYGDRKFKFARIKAPRSINSNGARRGHVNELVIWGGYEIPRR